MTVVVLVSCLNQSLKFGNIVWVSEVDHINGNIVLSQSLSETFILNELLLEWMSAEDDYSRLGILVHSMLKGELSDFDCGNKVTLAIYKNNQIFG